MDTKLSPVFNALSGADRLKLKTAAMMTAISGVACDETKQAPWKFPFYCLYIGFIALPIPIPGTNMIPFMLLLGWYGLGLTERARLSNRQIKDKFNHATLVEDHKDFIREEPEASGRFRVLTVPLVIGANKIAWRDMLEAKRAFVKAVRDFVM
jgi:hypothetical protein